MRGLVGGFRAAIFFGFILVYVVVLGQNWGWYSAAVMVAAYRLHGGRLLEDL